MRCTIYRWFNICRKQIVSYFNHDWFFCLKISNTFESSYFLCCTLLSSLSFESTFTNDSNQIPSIVVLFTGINSIAFEHWMRVMMYFFENLFTQSNRIKIRVECNIIEALHESLRQAFLQQIGTRSQSRIQRGLCPDVHGDWSTVVLPSKLARNESRSDR
jgi:hypothetical protein